MPADCFGLASGLVFAALFPAPPGLAAVVNAAGTPRPPPDVTALHARALVVDAHADSTQKIVYEAADFIAGIPGAHLDLAKMRAGDIDAQFLSIFVSPKRTPAPAYFSEALRQIEAVKKTVARSNGVLGMARTAAEVRENAKRGVRSILLGVEGGHALGVGASAEQLTHLRMLAGEGVRYLTLTWSNSNAIGGSSGDGGDGQGLTPSGRQIIDEMNNVGMVVDLSHVSDPLFWDAIRHAKKPVLLSHSSARSVANVPRNVTDAMMRAVARNGGAVCVNFNPAFLDSEYRKAQAPIWKKYEQLPLDESWRRVRQDSALLPPVPLARLVDHVMHMVQIAGIDHVCLGSDFDGIVAVPDGMHDASQLVALTAALRARGLSPESLEKILGTNTLRVLEANEGR